MYIRKGLAWIASLSLCVSGWLTCPCLNLNVLGGWRHFEDVFHTCGQVELAWSVDVGVVLHRVSHSIKDLDFWAERSYGILVL